MSGRKTGVHFSWTRSSGYRHDAQREWARLMREKGKGRRAVRWPAAAKACLIPKALIKDCVPSGGQEADVRGAMH